MFGEMDIGPPVLVNVQTWSGPLETEGLKLHHNPAQL